MAYDMGPSGKRKAVNLANTGHRPIREGPQPIRRPRRPTKLQGRRKDMEGAPEMPDMEQGKSGTALPMEKARMLAGMTGMFANGVANKKRKAMQGMK